MEHPAEINPYQSPGAAENETTIADADDQPTRRIYIAWGCVFAGNLVVPLLVGWGVTERGGRWGMFAAAALLFVVGYWLCGAARGLSKALVVGGVAVGLTQAIPGLQIMAGIAGLGLVNVLRLERAFGQDDHLPHITNELSGFVVTLATGGLLMTAALVVGLAIRGLFSKRR